MKASEDPEFKQQQARLKIAMEKIRAVLKEYDLMGYIIIQDTQAAEFLLHVQASWSVASIEERFGLHEIRFRALREQFASVLEQKRCVEATAGAFFCLAHNLEMHRQSYVQLIAMLAEHYPAIKNFIEYVEPGGLYHAPSGH